MDIRETATGLRPRRPPVYAPITAALVSTLSWQQTYVVLAVVLAVITLPGHVFGLGLPWTPAERQPHRSRAPDAVARSGAFIVLAAAMSLAAFAVYAAVFNLIPLLHQRGLTTGGAAVALGLGGVGQVLGRLGYGRLTAATDVRTRTAVVLVAAAATIILLGLLPGPAPRTVRDGGSLADLGGSAYHVALSGKVDELLADQRVRESYLGIS